MTTTATTLIQHTKQQKSSKSSSSSSLQRILPTKHPLINNGTIIDDNIDTNNNTNLMCQILEYFLRNFIKKSTTTTMTSTTKLPLLWPSMLKPPTLSTPKPRPPAPTTRPNITFQTYACPEAYAKWYCLNGATCFSVRIGESILYNCECANGYMGQRCEFKDLEGSYPGMPSRESKILEAGIAGGVITVSIVFVFVILLSYNAYLRIWNIVQMTDNDKTTVYGIKSINKMKCYKSTDQPIKKIFKKKIQLAIDNVIK
ncbi:hypothetical protein HUG17_1709 [Dermatophagoides farinae]|uniref:EGF-like domain-containing protein n=1 Tax=Dermatophagoides farinae TaxID=6954 RepID=A0A9D4P950_DERFA|nr:hypothetical protein HUG17_1709 [Dermatophagoides farinae]